MTTKIESVTRKIALLMERANHPGTPPAEAESCRSKADALMFQYQIDAATAEKSHQQQDVPQWATVFVCRYDNEWVGYYAHLARAVARHIGVRIKEEYVRNADDGFNWFALQVCGFAADLEMFQLLWAQTQVEFVRRFEPKYDRNLSDAVNAFLMRMAGMERRRIAAVMFPGWTTTNEMKARTRKVTKLIKEGAEEMGEDASSVLGRQGASIKTHRVSYATGFVYTLSNRMDRLRTERGQDERGLVLVSRKDRINEAFYEKYPNMRPTPAGTKVLGDPREDCVKCRKAASGYCREHQWMKPSTARPRGQRVSYDAYTRGADAARAIDLGPGGRGRVSGAGSNRALKG